eukprot:Hpha_TRINITY_DN12782_c0_g2::TRINITY_DN12782_c0_g2_i1::g.114598::m.114598
MSLAPAPPRRQRGQDSLPSPTASPPGQSPREEASAAQWDSRDKVYNFVRLTPQQREAARSRELASCTQQALGGRFIARERANASVKGLGKLDRRLEAVQQGVSEWEIRRQASRQALAQLPPDPRASPALPSPTSNAEGGLSLLAKAAEFGLGSGQSYFSIPASTSARLEKARLSPSRTHQTPGAAGKPVDPSLADARTELERLQAMMASGAQPGTGPDGKFSYDAYMQTDFCDVDVSRLSYQDMKKVAAAVELLKGRFPQSSYLGPLYKQFQNFSV